MQSQVQTYFPNRDLLNYLPSLILAILSVVVAIFSYFYVKGVFKKADEIEENIFIVKGWADNLEYIVYMQRGPYVSQPLLDKIVEKERKPLEAELESLKMERQFLLDRVPLLGVLKK
ncbi:hypothetical protein HYT60_00670 [Candidatus Woesebacteria bacterium]|nr:hypothetical protein [Candidatus Woesebacteria bacterium]